MLEKKNILKNFDLFVFKLIHCNELNNYLKDFKIYNIFLRAHYIP